MILSVVQAPVGDKYAIKQDGHAYRGGSSQGPSKHDPSPTHIGLDLISVADPLAEPNFCHDYAMGCAKSNIFLHVGLGQHYYIMIKCSDSTKWAEPAPACQSPEPVTDFNIRHTN